MAREEDRDGRIVHQVEYDGYPDRRWWHMLDDERWRAVPEQAGTGAGIGIHCWIAAYSPGTMVHNISQYTPIYSNILLFRPGRLAPAYIGIYWNILETYQQGEYIEI